jgi:CRISPR-associated protein Csy1
MNHAPSPRTQALQQLIHQFVQERLKAKPKKLKNDDPKRADLHQQYRTLAWLRDAAKRSSGLQMVTHTVKGIHPSAKGASNLLCRPLEMPQLTEVGSHLLGADPLLDCAVDNANKLDVFDFLKRSLPGEEDRNLLTLCRQADPDWLAALSDDADEAQSLCQQFAALEAPRTALSSHTLAKQVLWPTDADTAQGWHSFHTLAPLFPSSLVHQVHTLVQNQRFGDTTEPQREAFKAGQWHAEPVHQFPNLAQVKLGGSNTQNISQLNSERGGIVLLLASLPPQWNTERLRPPLRLDSLFDARRGPWARRQDVIALVDELASFLHLQTDGPAAVNAVRQQQDALAAQLVDLLLVFTLELREGLEPGWSQQPDCRLPLAQRQWLDPEGSPCQEPDTTTHHMAQQFALWLSSALRAHKLDMDAASAQHWHTLAHGVLEDHAPEAQHAL